MLQIQLMKPFANMVLHCIGAIEDSKPLIPTSCNSQFPLLILPYTKIVVSLGSLLDNYESWVSMTPRRSLDQLQRIFLPTSSTTIISHQISHIDIIKRNPPPSPD